MQKQFAIVPGIGANNKRVTETHATCVGRDNAGAARGLGQLWAVRQRDSIDNQHSDPGTIADAGATRIFCMTRTQRCTAGQNEIFLCFGPLIGKRQELLEGLLINHEDEGIGKR